ncbi:DUF982 domain-containing protein [Ensifer adhaerens]|uniref:DUF982 domain-containing protein n=1 Tax=Ensifer adhaerens TaxID=106592 RepID=UPI003B832B56
MRSDTNKVPRKEGRFRQFRYGFANISTCSNDDPNRVGTSFPLPRYRNPYGECTSPPPRNDYFSLFFRPLACRRRTYALREIPSMVPLSVRLQPGTNRIFASVYDALDFLEHEWPIRRGEGYERTCRGALNHWVPQGGELSAPRL